MKITLTIVTLISVGSGFSRTASAQTPAIVPIAECVQADLAHPGQQLVQFGYASNIASEDGVAADYGSSNNVSIDGADVGPASGAPASLLFGVHTNVFSVRAPLGAIVMWTLYDPATAATIGATPTAATPECIPEGPRGPAGAAGMNGAKGPDGEQGPQGLEGERGPAGTDGLAGPQGIDGPMGGVGPVGDQGPQGLAGADGNPGAAGAPGLQGPPGETGPTGPDGETGPAGLPGTQGLPGLMGAQGQTGPIGPEGPQGLPGNEGPDGKRGVRGERGARGPEGDVGPSGEQGDQGNIGKPGVKGPVGPAGAAGEIPASTVLYLFDGEPVPAGFAFVTSWNATLMGNGQAVTLRMYRK